ncbi:MAG: 3-hydroxyisobutyrate dehydrogenase [Rhodospirillaceae bacterium]|jgi:3-hydroxyisobutyrate dehydrogenase|nr:3-hydroxyisobutyrate dehydrogenase [Rhodospirillaceae bacterium]MBT6205727.1 3-hydroxyisobutyrate dehydrogenase [Rhodospirillaceae bacterium]MBT6510790.1 3-hydroxyisobutyrate dehydrogenase [Rhodospirillaceae bacterium]
MQVSFIGLGTMGLPMAITLVGTGFQVTGFDLDPGACQRLEKAGGKVAAGAEEAMVSADISVSMLPEGRHVRDVLNETTLGVLKSSTLLVDCSTIDVTSAQELAALATRHGHGFVDAPVSGGAEGAAAGTLAFMAGGAPDDLARARPLLEAMGAKVLHFGAAGSGQAAKACHNMNCGITALGVCEAFALADGLGLDHGAFFDLCRNAAAQSWILENRCLVPGPAPEAPASNRYAPGFAARLMAKDLGLAQDAAQSCGQATPFGAEAARRFAEFAAGDGGDLDFSAIYRTIREV